MDSLTLELKIVSASDLKKSNPFSSSIQPYVVVWIYGGGAASPTQKTPVDANGGRNPTWNHSLTLSVPGNFATNDLTLKFQIRSHRTLAADKLIGEVCVPLRDLLPAASALPAVGKVPASAKFVGYQVKKPSGRPKGVLTFSYRFVNKASGAVATEEPVMAYPTKPQTSSTVYPAANLYPSTPPPSAPPAGGDYYPPVKPQATTGYSAVEEYKYDVYPPPSRPQPVTVYPAVDGYKYDIYPPPPRPQPTMGYPAVDGYNFDVHPQPPRPQPTTGQTSYGYPVQGGYGYAYHAQTGYGYPGQTGYGCGNGCGYGYTGPVVQPKRKKNNSGLGLGAGLLGGALAGMLVGDLVSDAAFDL